MWKYWRERPTQDHEDDQGTEVFLIQGKAEGAKTFQAGEEKANEDLIHVQKYLMVRAEMELDTSRDARCIGHKWVYKKFCLNIRKTLTAKVIEHTNRLSMVDVSVFEGYATPNWTLF